MPVRFEKSCLVPASAAVVADFHCRPANLLKISPPWMRVIELDAPERLENGSRLALTARVLGMTQRWVVRVEKVSQDCLVDVAEVSPFCSWRHQHEFHEVGAGQCRMIDRVECSLPGEPWTRLGYCMVRWMLALMFRQRHAATQKFFLQP